MSETASTAGAAPRVFARGELHAFDAAGRRYVYLSSSAAVFTLDDRATAVLAALDRRGLSRDELKRSLPPGLTDEELDETLRELLQVRAVVERSAPAPRPRTIPLAPIPLATMVLNVTSQCNLACAYCYEYGQDRVVDEAAHARKPKFMSAEVARQSVDFMLRESGASPVANITFFGGETLLNFPVLRQTVEYARARAADVGKRVEFSLTTNATLLKPEVADFLVENDVGVTISIDGPKELQDRFRVFHNGAGSYDVIAPRIKALIAKRRRRPVAARVTLTGQTLAVKTIFRHLVDDIGFDEVGFAPATTAPTRGHAIDDAGFDRMLGEFRELAGEFLEHALVDRPHAFSNVKETISEIHKGANKSHPCGAGFGLLGVAVDGDVGLCHRFAGSDAHKFGTVHEGVDRAVQAAFLAAHHVDDKTDCRQCWARPLCAGGCYHEAYTRYGDTNRPNLHYCEWIRGWTDVCLHVYGELAARNPAYLRRFEVDDEAPEAG